MNAPDKFTALAGQLQIDNDLLRTFAAIVDTGSFSKAAQAVFRTPSAVSMQIKKLEELLGTSVFERDSRSVALTPSGEILLSYARRILALNQEMLARFATPEMTGTVRIGAPDDYGTALIPHVLKKFAITHPNVIVDGIIDSSDSLKERFRAEKADIIIYNTIPGDPLEDNSEVLLEEELVWVGKRGGCAHTRDPLPLAMWEQGCVWRTNAVEALNKAGRRYRVAYLSGNYVVQMAAIEADLAIAPIPPLLIGPSMARLGPAQGFPDMKPTQIRMMSRPDATCTTQAMADHIRTCVDAWKAGELEKAVC
ncbi:LysR family transcriptional regulator [Oricola sp.]|uniref:LysR family transcriptional regulator n=1 Tax=Oricola sp. TaxID=1979950 RepID=UPI003BA86B12